MDERQHANYTTQQTDQMHNRAHKSTTNLATSEDIFAWIARLRTGHCSLIQYLERFNIINDGKCECGQAMETVKHYLLTCAKYERERDKLRRRVGAQGMRVEKLLGNARRIGDTIQFIED